MKHRTLQFIDCFYVLVFKLKEIYLFILLILRVYATFVKSYKINKTLINSNCSVKAVYLNHKIIIIFMFDIFILILILDCFYSNKNIVSSVELEPFLKGAKL